MATVGLAVNAALAIAKGIAGIVGHSYALVADAAESVADIGGSIVVYSGLRVAARSPDYDHPYGHGKAEPLATAAVGLLLCAAALGIMVESVESMLAEGELPRGGTWVQRYSGAMLFRHGRAGVRPAASAGESVRRLRA